LGEKGKSRKGGNCYVLQLEATRHHSTKPLSHQRIKFQHSRAMRS